MDWKIDSRLYQLINPHVARTFSVLPVGGDRKCLLLVTDKKLSKDERQNVEEEICFQLGVGAVKLHLLGEWPTLDESSFAIEMDRWFGVRGSSFISQPVSADLMTVLLVDHDTERSKEMKAKLESDGFEVAHVTGIGDGVAFLKRSTRNMSQILIWDDSVADKEAAFRELKAIAPRAILVDAMKNHPEFVCPRSASVSVPSRLAMNDEG